jgi:protein-disulfide isomerase
MKSEDMMMAKSNKRRDEERRAAAAAKVAEMQRAQRAAERRNRSLMISAAVVAVVVVIVGVFVLVQISGKSPTVAASGVGGSTNKYGFVVGDANAPATLVVYEDFQCPSCKEFEHVDGPTVSKYISDGKVKVEFRPIAILDRFSSTNYSTRSLNAAACVRNYSTAAAFKTFHDLLYAHQPEENSAGLPDSQLITYAGQAMHETNPDVATCINDGTYEDWASSATEASSKDGITATPTILLDGDQVDLQQNETATKFKALLDAAVAKGSKTK